MLCMCQAIIADRSRDCIMLTDVLLLQGASTSQSSIQDGDHDMSGAEVCSE